MPYRLPSLERRRLIGMLTTLPVLGGARTVLPTLPSQAPIPRELSDATIWVAGPRGCPLDRWARLVRPALAQSLAPGAVLHLTNVGGVRGITAANQFETRGTLDGLTLLMVPGATVLAWLVGETTAKFDVSRWVAVMAAITPGVVVGRPAALAGGGPVRIAATSVTGPDLPALLGVELLGNRAQPVPRLGDNAAIQTAFRNGKIDAALLRGHHVPEQVHAMAAAGARPLFSLGVLDEFGHLIRATAFRDVPLLRELYRTKRGTGLSGPLARAWASAALASQLEFGLVVPVLTPAPMVALWRRAGQEASAALDIRALAASLAVCPLSGPAATACGDLLSPPAPALLALRQWLAERFNWRPT